ncbi:hypothetical protein MAM1_0580d10959 [Mucor ambiguus]|uniref:Uncharacterized protein n=1 Tax=Mucor ambiguus TaxID=91626 RepID=A0A0C9N5Q8_9FUNG|nr:hypothetical protein MAM1_0580d10959 [Mucor ambiguus]
MARKNAIAKELKQSIRSYNPALSFTFMIVDLDRRYANEKHGAYAFCIHESAHHLMSPELIPSPNNAIQQPQFAQIYISDSANEFLFVDIFKTMEELSSEQSNGIQNIQIVFRAESDKDIRR